MKWTYIRVPQETRDALRPLQEVSGLAVWQVINMLGYHYDMAREIQDILKDIRPHKQNDPLRTTVEDVRFLIEFYNTHVHTVKK